MKNEIKNFGKITNKLYKQTKDLVHQLELEYIVKRSLMDKIMDSIKGKNN